MSYDNRASTAGYNPGYAPQSPDIASTGYVHCRETDQFRVPEYPGTSAQPQSYEMMDEKPSSSYDVIDEEPSTIVAIEGTDKTKLVNLADLKPNDYMELTLVACFFNFIFGLVAMALAFKSRESWEGGERQSARSYGIGSMAMSVFGILTTAIMVFILVWYFVLRTAADAM